MDFEIKKNEMGGICSMCKRVKKCIQGFGVGYLSERGDLEDLAVDGKIILKWTLKEWDGGRWIRFIWPGIATNDWLLRTRQQTLLLIRYILLHSLYQPTNAPNNIQ